METQKPRILIVDDDEGTCKSLALVFGKEGFEVVTAKTGRAALDKVQAQFFNVVILDIWLEDIRGTGLVGRLKKVRPEAAFVLITGHASRNTAIEAANEGVCAYITKPLDFDRLFTVIREALEKQYLLFEKRKAEKALRESEKRYRTLIEHCNDGIDIIGGQTLLYVNQRLVEMLGYQRSEELVGKSAGIIVHPEDRERVLKIVTKRQRGEPVPTTHEFRAIRKDGTILWIEASATTIEHNGSRASLAFLRDVTERRKTEQALKDSQAKFKEVMDNAREAIVVTQEGLIKFVNKRAREITGHAETELLFRSLNDFVHPEDEHLLLPLHRERRTGEKHFPAFTLRLVCNGGRTKWVEVNSSLSLWEGLPAFLNFFSDVTERRKLEEDRALLATAIEQAAESVIITDRDGTIQYVNPAFETITGYTRKEVLGENPRILKSGKQQEGLYKQLWETILRGNTWKGHFINRKKDGSLYREEASISPVLDSSGKVVNHVAVKRDVTEEWALEEQLRQAQKMEAMGTLAGGIAHDFNNILSAISGYTEMAMVEIPKGFQARNDLAQVLRACTRARELVKQILAFSRQSEEEQKPIKVSSLLKETLKLIRASFPSNIQIEHEINVRQDTLLASPTQIHQILMNLCTNASHAMRENGGRLMISLVDAGERGARPALSPKGLSTPSPPPELTQGRYLLLRVEDTGHGMPPEVMERIFDPYFTTKEKGVGTGMGLAVVQGIIKKLGGIIQVHSHVGQGTLFEVFLPLAEEEVPVETQELGFPEKGTGRILFVDDEQALAEIGKRMLCHLGFDTAVRTSSIEALEAFRAQPQAFDLVITDMTMPKMTGDTLAKELMKIRPDIPIILCTGFSERITEDTVKEIGIKALVMKPIVMGEIARTIWDVLSSEGPERH